MNYLKIREKYNNCLMNWINIKFDIALLFFLEFINDNFK